MLLKYLLHFAIAGYGSWVLAMLPCVVVTEMMLPERLFGFSLEVFCAIPFGAALGYGSAKVLRHQEARWAWTPYAALFLWVVLDGLGMPGFLTIFGYGCKEPIQCFSAVLFASPFYTAVAYSMVAASVLRRLPNRGKEEPFDGTIGV